LIKKRKKELGIEGRGSKEDEKEQTWFIDEASEDTGEAPRT